ncbi:hypothetical protein O9G_001136 [Rozella allomycis CSF55]|uniref:CDP-alcohol phosphatidyltransferase domain-containing protein n=1 Tax=Rozella allomycis (strain CSF55) TaxID=988480 RepID=A0A075AWT9_ROZAC|nr:hypothetical protein O9G_001136 [Rozella allomycis CSF55]|eukprot:EPZ33167.1 hypothetical protein O9G_001136 [Rozella allomycis CSF55]
MSGPLGELFDHGCDALNTSLIVLQTISALSLVPSHMCTILHLSTMFGFYMTTWEEFHTGTLYLGHISGPEFWTVGRIWGIRAGHVVLGITIVMILMSCITRNEYSVENFIWLQLAVGYFKALKGRIILSHCLKEEFPIKWNDGLLIAYLISNAILLVVEVDERFGYFLFLIYGVEYFVFAVSVINEICEYLKIECFKVKLNKDKE